MRRRCKILSFKPQTHTHTRANALALALARTVHAHRQHRSQLVEAPPFVAPNHDEIASLQLLQRAQLWRVVLVRGRAPWRAVDGQRKPVRLQQQQHVLARDGADGGGGGGRGARARGRGGWWSRGADAGGRDVLGAGEVQVFLACGQTPQNNHSRRSSSSSSSSSRSGRKGSSSSGGRRPREGLVVVTPAMPFDL